MIAQERRAEAPTTEPGVAPGSAGFVDSAQAMLEFYAQSHGWRIHQWLQSPEQLSEAVASVLHKGTVLIVPNLAALSSKPSGQESAIATLIARGVILHVVSLSGPIEPHIPVLREAWEAGQAAEAELAAALEREGVMEADYEAKQRLFESTVMAKMSEAFGVEKISAKLFAKTDTPGPGFRGQGTVSAAGDEIKHLRSKRNLSLQEAADLCGMAKTTYRRLETGEDVDPAHLASARTKLNGGAHSEDGAGMLHDAVPEPHSATAAPTP